MESVRANPLLDPEIAERGLPPFDQVELKDYMPALEEALAGQLRDVERIKANPEEPTFENTLLALEHSFEPAEWVARIYLGLMNAHADESFRAIAQEFLPRLTEQESDISLDPVLFERLSKLHAKRADLGLEPEELRLLEKRYLDAVRNGAKLDEEGKKRLKAVSSELSALGPKFSQNVLASTNAFEYHTEDQAQLAGLPQGAQDAARREAQSRGKDTGWTFTLQEPSVSPVMQYAEDRELRETLTRAGARVAFGDEFDNQDILKRVAILRRERAQLLGYDSHLEHALVERMAGSPDEVRAFVDRFIEAALPVARQELAEIQALALKLDGIEDVRPWDLPYYREKLKKEQLDFDEEQLRPYFDLDRVLDGMFEITKKLYGVTCRQLDGVPVHHEEVTVHEVLDADGEQLGILFVDLFPRDTKSGGAWMNVWRRQGVASHGAVRPVVSITANLTPRDESGKSQLQLNEVRTLFHEFGHALHGLLSQCTQPALAGPEVFWDFVELPSQIMENWAFAKEGLDVFARHCDTGEKIPEELVEAIQKSRSFHAGMQSLRQAAYELVDLAWFGEDTREVEDVVAYEREATKPVRLLEPMEGSCLCSAFAHIFAGGYAAGYYSYRWSAMLDADAFSRFEEEGLFCEATARSFRKEILEKGNGADPAELFRSFRGRDPKPDALLRRLNFVEA